MYTKLQSLITRRQELELLKVAVFDKKDIKVVNQRLNKVNKSIKMLITQ